MTSVCMSPLNSVIKVCGFGITEELTRTSKIILNLLANSGCLLYRNVTNYYGFCKGFLIFVGALK